MGERLIVLLGDIEDSRRVADRAGLAVRLESSCERLNAEFEPELRAPFSILKGIDEVGAALVSFGRALEMMSALSAGLRPQRMRFVLAAGEVDTAAGSGVVARMDGPVFHRAARMMEELKTSKLLFAMSVGDPLLDEALASAVNMLLLARVSLSDRQWEAMAAYERSGSQASAAAALGVSQQAVSHALVSANYRQMKRVEERLNVVFQEYSLREKGRAGDVVS